MPKGPVADIYIYIYIYIYMYVYSACQDRAVEEHGMVSDWSAMEAILFVVVQCTTVLF